MKLTYEELRQSGNIPRIHPNGFIQLDLEKNLRLHVWPTERLIAPAVDLPLHDHTFGFNSFVVKGSLGNIIYDIERSDAGAYHLYHVMPYAATGTSSPLQKQEGAYDIRKTNEFWIDAGHAYHMDPFIFHETAIKEPSVTVIRIIPFDTSRPARVLCPATETPGPAFKRDAIAPDILWEYIKEALETSPHTTLPEGF